MGNAIYDPSFRITVDGVVMNDTAYDVEARLYTVNYTIEHAGETVVSTSYEGVNLGVYTGIYDVPKANATLIVTTGQNNVFAYGDNVTVFIGLYDNETWVGLTDNITVIVDSTPMTVEVIDGEASFNVTGFEPGKYAVMGIFDGNTNYNGPVYNSTVFEVLYPDRILSIEAPVDIMEGEIAVINVTVTDYNGNKQKGTVVLNIGGHEFVAIIDGNDSVAIYDVPVGIYTVNATLLEEGLFAEVVNDTESFSVIAKDDAIINVTDIVINIGEPAVINASLHFSMAGENVTITVVGIDSKVVTIDANGTAIAEFTGLAAGEYEIVVTYDGDRIWNAATANATLTVNKLLPEVNATDVSYIEDGEGIMNITGPANGILVVSVNGTNYAIGLDDNGNATLDVSGLAPGTYPVDITYIEDDFYEGTIFSNAATIFVEAKDDADINVTDVVINVDDVAVINAGLHFSMAGENVTITVAGKGSQVVTIDANGTAVAKFDGLAAGEYEIVVTYGGDDIWNAAVANATLTVNKLDPVVTASDVSYIEDGEGIMNITGPSDREGNLIVSINGTDYAVTLDRSGNATLDVSGLAPGNYNVDITYIENDKYNAVEFNNIAFIIVEPKDDAIINISDVVITYGDVAVINAGLHYSTAGESVVIIVVGKGSEVATIDANGTASAKFDDLAAGEYEIIVFYGGDDIWNAAVANATLTVEKATPTINITDVVVKYLELGTFTVETNVPGYYTLTINGTEVGIFKVEDVLDIDVLFSYHAPGSYEAVISVDESENYTAGTATASVTIEKQNTTLEIYDVDTDEDTQVTEIAVDISALGRYVTVDGNISVTVENESGIVAIITSDIHGYYEWIDLGVLAPGKYNITAVYTGDEYFEISTPDTIEYEVPKVANATMDVAVDPAEVGEDVVIAITLPEDATGDVNVTIGNETYNATVENGTATVIVPAGLAAGTYPAEVAYSGDDKYEPVSATTNVVVNKVPDAEINATAEPTEFGSDAVINVTLPEDATGTVVAEIDGKLYVAKVENGTATITVPGLEEGNYAAAVTYNGDGKYESVSTSVDVEVVNGLRIKAPDVVKYYHGPESFVVYTTDYAGNPIENITVKITVNGVTYTRTSDSNGEASLGLNLPSRNYTVKVEFAGNEKYEAQNLTADVVILPTIFGNDIVKIFRNGTQYRALFVDFEGKPLANTVVSFNINGIFYNRTTDESGWAQLDINLPVGEYILTAINPVTGEMISNNVTVLTQFVEHGDLDKVAGDPTPYVVKIRTKDGSIAGAGEVVSFNINGRLYDCTTNESGEAKLDINLPAGEYIITGSYGDEKISDKITVRAA